MASESLKLRRCATCSVQMPLSLAFRFPLLLLLAAAAFSPCSAQKRRIHVGDKLEDVVDSEEDEDWKAWGRPKEPQMPKSTLGKTAQTLDMAAMKEYTGAKLKGKAFGWVMLRPKEGREREEAMHLAYQWEKLLLSGGIRSEFQPVDSMTIWFELQDDRYIEEVIEFLLDQHDVYEFRVGDYPFRRKGDEPLSKVLGRNVWEEVDRAKDLILGTSKSSNHMEL